jgi:hypothetical protein
MNLAIGARAVAHARKRARAFGTSANQLIRRYLRKLAGGDDPKASVEEFKGGRSDEYDGLMSRLKHVRSSGPYTRDQMNER